MPDATLALKKNGGAATAGGITAAIGDTIQPTALDKSGWSGTPRWELWIYETGTYTGYTSDGAPGLPTLFALGIADPPSFAIATAGLYELRLIYGGGAIVSKAIIKVPYANGNSPIGPDETSEFGGVKLGAYTALNANNAAAVAGAAATTLVTTLNGGSGANITTRAITHQPNIIATTTGAITCDCTLSDVHHVVAGLTGDIAVTFTGLARGMFPVLLVKQSAGTLRHITSITPTPSVGFEVSQADGVVGDTDLDIVQTVNRFTLFEFYYDGSKLRLKNQQGYAT